MLIGALLLGASLHPSKAEPFNHGLSGWPSYPAPSSSYPPGPILPAYHRESYLLPGLPGEHPWEEPLMLYRCPNPNISDHEHRYIWRCVPARGHYRPFTAEGQTIEMSAFRFIALSQSRVAAGSTVPLFYREYPVFLPGVGQIGRFRMTWSPSTPLEVHISASIDRVIMLATWRQRRGTELLSLSLIWGLYSTEFRDRQIRRESNPEPLAPVGSITSHTPGAERLQLSVSSEGPHLNHFGEYLYTRSPTLQDPNGPAMQRENLYSLELLLNSARHNSRGSPVNLPFNTFILFRVVASEERPEYLNNGHIDTILQHWRRPASPPPPP